MKSTFLKYLVPWLVVFCSCTGTKNLTKSKAHQENFKYSYCAPNVFYEQKCTRPEEPETTAISLPDLSLHDQLLCSILGITQEVGQLSQMKSKPAQENLLAVIALRQKILNKIVLAQSQLQAVAAELDCEGERADMAARYLDDIDSKRNRKLTIASVITGALTTVATAILSDNDVQVATAVGGGLLSAGLGALTINPKGAKIAFYHRRNLLAPIWSDTVANNDYPDFVWQMLHEKRFSNKGDVTLAESIKRRWLQFDLDEGLNKEQLNLLFGAGGYYHADDLHSRAAMVNQLQSTIRSFHQDLTSFVVYINALD